MWQILNHLTCVWNNLCFKRIPICMVKPLSTLLFCCKRLIGDIACNQGSLARFPIPLWKWVVVLMCKKMIFLAVNSWPYHSLSYSLSHSLSDIIYFSSFRALQSCSKGKDRDIGSDLVTQWHSDRVDYSWQIEKPFYGWWPGSLRLPQS